MTPSTQPPTKKVLIAGVTGDRLDASTHFALSLLKLQMEAAPQGNVQLTVTFVNSLNDALNTALETESDVLVAVDSKISFSPQFVFGEPGKTPDVVVGVHPLPGIDWDKVKAALATNTEPLESAGFMFNVTPAADTPCTRYIPVSDATTSIVRLNKKALLELALVAETSSDGKHKVFVRDGVVDGVFVPKDRWLLQAYKKTVFADVEHPCSYSGIAEFAGCVGQRQQLR